MPTSDAIALTSRARIEHLEGEVSSLWTAVRSLRANRGNVRPESASLTQQPSQTENSDGSCEKRSDGDVDANSNAGSAASELSPAYPPTHLLQLFDNNLLDTNEDGSAAPSSHATSLHKANGNSALRRLMPIREDMLIISTSAASWMSLYNAIFPAINFIKTSDDMLSQYDKLQHPNANPVATAALLLSVAITIQQAPDDTAGCARESIRDASSYIKDVSDVVERIVISDDALAGSLEGIETSMLFLRLQLGRGKVRKTWLLLRRVIALAELIGLPRSSIALVSHQEPSASTSHGDQLGVPPSFDEMGRRKADLWESICAIDRTTSMMWSLPLATANFPLPKRPIVDSQGRVDPGSYQYNLVDVASQVLELDNIYSTSRPLMELLDAVVHTDRELRSLASITPQSWWRMNWPQLSIDALLQYWHQYLTVRTHLQLALKHNEGQEFAFSFITCLDACQEVAKRYVSLRPILPAGFFANWVIDLQTLTAIVFLLLASCRNNTPGFGTFRQAIDVNVIKGIVNQATRTMGFAAARVGGNCARQAADAVASLRSLLQPTQVSGSQKITLNLPLVGKIHVARKPQIADFVPQQPYPSSSQQSQSQVPWQTATANDTYTSAAQSIPFISSDLNGLDSLTYLMEIPENYDFLTNDAFGTEQWFINMASDGNR